MTITTPLHAEHQLDQLAGQFAHWRQTRTHPYERIPQALWNHAVALASTLPPSRVAKQLRVRLADLKKQMVTRHVAPAAASPLPLSFVEVPPAPCRAPHRAVPRRWHPAVHPRPGVPPAAGHGGARLCGGPLMLQLTPQSRILLATQPVDFRKGIDGLTAVCRQVLRDNPLEGAVYVFRNRAGTARKLLLYARQGYWLCMKRLSQGCFTWWPKTADAQVPLSARELIIVLRNGDPERAHMAADWRRVA